MEDSLPFPSTHGTWVGPHNPLCVDTRERVTGGTLTTQMNLGGLSGHPPVPDRMRGRTPSQRWGGTRRAERGRPLLLSVEILPPETDGEGEDRNSFRLLFVRNDIVLSKPVTPGEQGWSQTSRRFTALVRKVTLPTYSSPWSLPTKFVSCTHLETTRVGRTEGTPNSLAR